MGKWVEKHKSKLARSISTGPLISDIPEAIEKIRKRDDLNADTIKYFMVKDPEFARFYLL